jgi:hypothetical protein
MTPARRFYLAFCLLLADDCSNAGGREKMTDYQRTLAMESLALARDTDTVYVRRVRDEIRRSRLVPTDSLVAEYLHLKTAPLDSFYPTRQQIACTIFHLGQRHGEGTTGRALSRMEDSLLRAGVDMKELSKRLDDPRPPWVELSERSCGPSPDVHLPDSLMFGAIRGRLPWK